MGDTQIAQSLSFGIAAVFSYLLSQMMSDKVDIGHYRFRIFENVTVNALHCIKNITEFDAISVIDMSCGNYLVLAERFVNTEGMSDFHQSRFVFLFHDKGLLILFILSSRRGGGSFSVNKSRKSEAQRLPTTHIAAESSFFAFLFFFCKTITVIIAEISIPATIPAESIKTSSRHP